MRACISIKLVIRFLPDSTIKHNTGVYILLMSVVCSLHVISVCAFYPGLQPIVHLSR